jgi:CheY-like chemotaxis protein
MLDRDEVHQALETLHDGVTLGKAPLLARFPHLASLPDFAERAQRLRAVLLEAIEVLHPSRRTAFGSREARACDVLTLRYVEKMSIAAVMEELSLSKRQVLRDLSQAESKLAEVLGDWAGQGPAAMPVTTSSPAPVTGVADGLAEELAILASQPAPVSLREVVGEAVTLVAPLAATRGITITTNCAVADDSAMADRAMLKQIVTQLLSWAIQSAGRPELSVTAADAGAGLSLRLLFHSSGPQEHLSRVHEIEHVAEHNHIHLQVSEASHVCTAVLNLRRARGLTVLVVEDNPGAVALYRRYLDGSAWQVRHVDEPRLVFEVARRLQPHAVLLDIMMPGTDGWSVLQSLRQRDETRDLPVVICSVLQDEELSRALGAAACLKKPVSQSDLLSALHRCLADRQRGGSPTPAPWPKGPTEYPAHGRPVRTD